MKKGSVVGLAGLLMLALIAVACSDDKKTAQTKGQEGAVQHSMQERQKVSVSGVVLEVADTQEFTFLRVQTTAGEKWVAVPQTAMKVGEQINIRDADLFQNFPSKTLGRTFDELIVAMSIDGKAPKQTASEKAAAPHQTMPAATQSGGADSFSAALQAEGAPVGGQHGPMGGAGQSEQLDPSLIGSNKAIVPFVDLKVEKAPGNNSYQVGYLFANGEKLDGQKVKVRGQVVKVSKQIMGRNWLHIQDGTGNTLKNTHDLVVTTAAAPEKGDIVVVEGVLHANRDFGAGYSYVVIVEDAVISQ